MLFGIQLTRQEWLAIFQIAVGLGPCIALVILFRQMTIHTRQLKTHGQSLNLSTIATRHQLFLSLADCVTAAMLETMMLHVLDHFDRDVYHERYKGNEQAIKSYLLMKRKYLYLLFARRLETHFPLVEQEIVPIWIDELARYQEFRDVHDSQKHYYREFGRYVTEIIGDRPIAGWMYEAHLAAPAGPSSPG